MKLAEIGEGEKMKKIFREIKKEEEMMRPLD